MAVNSVQHGFLCNDEIRYYILAATMYLPHGAMGWSAVCDCGISLSYSLFDIVIFTLIPHTTFM